jgi:hypothetical protein
VPSSSALPSNHPDNVAAQTQSDAQSVTSRSSKASKKDAIRQNFEKRAKARKVRKPRATVTDGTALMNLSATDAQVKQIAEIDAKMQKLQDMEEKAKEANEIEAKVDVEIDLNRRRWDTTVGRIWGLPDFIRGLGNYNASGKGWFSSSSDWLPTEQHSKDHIIGVDPADVGHVRNISIGAAKLLGGMIPVTLNCVAAVAVKCGWIYLLHKTHLHAPVSSLPRIPAIFGILNPFVGLLNFAVSSVNLTQFVLANVFTVAAHLVVRTIGINWMLKQTVADLKYEITIEEPREEPFHDLRAVASLHNRLLRTVMPAAYTLVVKKRIPKIRPSILLAIPSVIWHASPAPLAPYITYEEKVVQTHSGDLSIELLAEICSADKLRASLTVGEAVDRLNEMSSFVGSFNFNRFDFTAYSQGTLVVAQAITKTRTLLLNVNRKSVLTDF